MDPVCQDILIIKLFLRQGRMLTSGEKENIIKRTIVII